MDKKKMSFADFLKAEGFVKESFEAESEESKEEAKAWINEMESKTITITGLDFNKAVAEIVCDMFMEHGVIKASFFIHGAFRLAEKLFDKEKEDGIKD